MAATAEAPPPPPDYGGGGAPSQTAPPDSGGDAETKTITVGGGADGETGGAVDVTVTVETNADTGAVTVAVKLDAETKEALIAEALKAAEEARENAASDEEAAAIVPTVVLDLSGIEGMTAFELDAGDAKDFGDAGKAFTVILPDAAVTLPPEALTALADAGGGIPDAPLTVQAENVPMSDLRGMQAAQVKGYETVISIDVFVGNTKVDVPLTVSLPYTLKANENPNAVRVWHMADDGTLTNLNGTFDSATGMITFTINHQSYFVVGYDPVALWANVFSDIDEGAWYYDAVAFSNHHGIFGGVGGGRFAPKDSMTRAMFVQVLWNLNKQIENGEWKMENGDEGNSQLFADVSESAWYYEAVYWAFANGIVEGIGDGLFAPSRNISRQEMAVMLHNYASFKGYDIPAHRAMPSFADEDAISSWAMAEARALSEAGVLNGSGSMFNPKSTATRAEVAQMFRNFMRLVVGEDPNAVTG